MELLTFARMSPRALVKARQADLVTVLEAAYAPSANLSAWLGGVLEALRRGYLGGGGCYGYSFERRSSGAMRFSDFAVAGLPDRFLSYARAATSAPPPEYADTMYNCPPCVTLSRLLPVRGDRVWFNGTPAAEELNAAMRRERTKDQLGLRAEDGSGRGVLIAAPLAEVRRLDRREGAVLMRLLAHLAAGSRLVRRPSKLDLDRADAVLTPAGRIEHVADSARPRATRAALTKAARRLDRARGALRRVDSARAVDEWRALVDGRWSLVDHFDHDGRRYLVARRNDPQPSSPRHELSKRELQVSALAALGHSNKLIAYELGLATSTVSAYLVSASRKLGVQSRVGLVRALARRGGTP